MHNVSSTNNSELKSTKYACTYALEKVKGSFNHNFHKCKYLYIL